jgi:hypothetical protein
MPWWVPSGHPDALNQQLALRAARFPFVISADRRNLRIELWTILAQLQMGSNLQAHDVTACWLSEGVVHGNGNILGAKHVMLVDEISLLRWAFLHHVASGLAGFNQAHLDSLGVDFFAESLREA